MSLNKVCRACLRSGQTMCFLFDSIVPSVDSPSNSIVDMYKIFSEILIASDTSLPNKICTDCFSEIQRTYYFMLKCERSEFILKKLKNVEIRLKRMETVSHLREHDSSNITQSPNENIEWNDSNSGYEEADVNGEDADPRLQRTLIDQHEDDNFGIELLDHVDCVNDNMNDDVSLNLNEFDEIESVDQYSTEIDACPGCCFECMLLESLENHIIDKHIERQMCNLCNPGISLHNTTMTNSIQFGPGWFRNNLNRDSRRSSNTTSTQSLSTQCPRQQEHRHSIQKNTAQHSKSGKISGRNIAPSYSSVVRGVNPLKPEKEKPPELCKGDTREFGILIERQYRERISGSMTSSIRLIDSSVLSKLHLQEKYIPRERGLVSENFAENDIVDEQDNRVEGTYEIEKEEGRGLAQRCGTISSNPVNEVNSNAFFIPTQEQDQENLNDYLESAIGGSNVEIASQVPIDVNYGSREINYNGYNSVKLPKSVNWHNEIHSSTRSEEPLHNCAMYENLEKVVHRDYTDLQKVVDMKSTNDITCPPAFESNDGVKVMTYNGHNSFNSPKSVRWHNGISSSARSEKPLQNCAMAGSLDNGARRDLIDFQKFEHKENSNRCPPVFEPNDGGSRLIYNGHNSHDSPKSVRRHNEISSSTKSENPLHNCIMADSLNNGTRSDGDYINLQNVVHKENLNDKSCPPACEPNVDGLTEWGTQNTNHNDVFGLNGIDDYFMFNEDIERNFNKNIEYCAKVSEPPQQWISASSRDEKSVAPATLDYNLITNPFLVADPPVTIAHEKRQINQACNYGDPHSKSSLYESWLLDSSRHVATPAISTRNDKITNPFLIPDLPETISQQGPASNQLWFYRDPQHMDQGPFMSTEMAEWFNCGYFDESLNVRRVCDSRFATLGELVKISGTRVPFLATHLIPPLQVNTVNSHGNPFIESMANQAY